MTTFAVLTANPDTKGEMVLAKLIESKSCAFMVAGAVAMYTNRAAFVVETTNRVPTRYRVDATGYVTCLD